MTVLLVLAGGAVGAPLRYLTDLVVSGRHDSVFPWGTLMVNAFGSLVLGAVASAVAHGGTSSWAMTLLGTGFCGGLTTFSTFGFETVRLVEDGSWVAACANVTANVLVGLAAVALGWAAVGLVS